MAAINVFIIGDSHTHAIKHALKYCKGVIAERVRGEAYRYARPKNGKVIGDLSEEQVLERVSALDPRDLVVSTMGGNQHQTLALVQHPTPFDLCMPGEDCEPGASGTVVIPYAQMWDVLERGLRGRDGQRLRQLRNAARCPIVHLVPPPPKEDSAHILKRHETNFVEAGILEKGVSPAPLRLKMWRIQTAVLEALAREWDIALLPPPEETLTADGYLDPVYYADDATHANAAYGERVLKQIERLVAAA